MQQNLISHKFVGQIDHRYRASTEPATMFFTDSGTSGQVRVLSPKTGLTQNCFRGTTLRPFFSKLLDYLLSLTPVGVYKGGCDAFRDAWLLH